MKKPKVYLVGAGPGDPGLISVRGLNILKQADVVIYDYLVDKRILNNAKTGAELICGHCPGRHPQSAKYARRQRQINKVIVQRVSAGKKVLRLKNGDPAIFARCAQELEALKAQRIEFELVPGITAASAAACLSGIPLTDRRYASSCVFIAGYEDTQKHSSAHDWASLSKCGTLVLYMAVANLGGIVNKLVAAGKDRNTKVAVVQHAGRLNQQIFTGTLADILTTTPRQQIMPPAIIIIGEIARLEKRLNWLKASRRILFTGLSEERYFNDGVYFHLPLIKIEPMSDYRSFDRQLRRIKTYQWIVFASRYGVEYFFQRLEAIGSDARTLAGIKIAAIGSSTRNRLGDFAITADLVPLVESAQGLLSRFKKENLKGKKIFLPRSDISDKGLAQGLKELGARVCTCVAYRNVPLEDLPDLDLRFFDEIMFTSPSAVRNFKQRYKKVPPQVKMSCIGEVTAREVQRCQLSGRED